MLHWWRVQWKRRLSVVSLQTPISGVCNDTGNLFPLQKSGVAMTPENISAQHETEKGASTTFQVFDMKT